ncbi:type VII secretion system-associated protein [Carbonactinospora thermoautotrophica]|uniref:type VII secretion system-associated protein n=1 Tax=Carbonactinospora thermoautotrophica TaxID=1469144 RepID=UPI00083325E5|nr:type VII secretion system-associated protein [Carbonactinospora thermoautotrophica]
MNERQQRPVPPITPELRRAAQEQRGGYLYAIDAMYDPNGRVPAHAIKGYWPVDERGELGEFVHNDHYRPSPLERDDIPPPTDDVDFAVQLAATGHGNDVAVLVTLVESEVFVPTAEDGQLLLIQEQDGLVLPVFTAEAHLPPGDHRWARHPMAKLAPILPPCKISINPRSRVKVRVPLADVLAVGRARGALEAPRQDAAQGASPASTPPSPPAGQPMEHRPPPGRPGELLPAWREERGSLEGLLPRQVLAELDVYAGTYFVTPERFAEQASLNVRLGTAAVRILAQCGITDADVLCAALFFRMVEPMYGGNRVWISGKQMLEDWFEALLRSATGPELHPGVHPNVVYETYLRHLRTTPWEVRAIVVANRIADVTTPWNSEQVRQNRFVELQSPLLSCAADFPEGLRSEMARVTGLDPMAAPPVTVVPNLTTVVTSADHALYVARQATGRPGEPAQVREFDVGYLVYSPSDLEPPQPGGAGDRWRVFTVHKLWGVVGEEVLTEVRRDGLDAAVNQAVSRFRARYAVFPLPPGWEEARGQELRDAPREDV